MLPLFLEPSFDTFGRVKVVQGAAVITSFFALQSIPCYPYQSFYVVSLDPAGQNEVTLELQRLDRTSIAIAYARGLFGALVVVGSIAAFFSIVTALIGANGRVDDFGRLMLNVVLGGLAVGVLGGIASYFLPLLGRRERKIRTYCGELCGLGVDPAVLHSRHSAYLQTLIDRTLDMQPMESRPMEPRRQTLLMNLITTRSRLAEFPGNAYLEAETDQWLQELDELSSSPTA